MKKVIGKGLAGYSVPSQKLALEFLEISIKGLNLKKYYFRAGVSSNASLKPFKKIAKDLFKKHNKQLASFTTVRRKKGYSIHIYKPYKTK